MEFIGLLGIIAVFTILIGSIMGIVAFSKISRIELELRRLRLQMSDPKRPLQTKTVAKSVPQVQRQSVKTEPKKQKEKLAQWQEPVASEPKVTPQKPKPHEKQDKIRRSFEEELGARWAVWVGGLALFLGAVFLLRYTIEAGFFTPVMRVAMASLFGAGLLGGGEYLRRHDILSRNKKLAGSELAKSLSENADIPGILTAVGIFTLLGTVYAAYALYGLIGPIPAFVLMGMLSLAALALGLLHGPKLAALGLVASLATPYLVQNDPPNAYNLYAYLIIIGIAALALARKRSWGWLNIATLFGMLGWIFMSLNATHATGTHLAWLGFTGLAYAASTYIAVHSKPNAQLSKLTDLEHSSWPAGIWAGLAAIAFLIAATDNDFNRLHYVSGLAGVGVLMAVGWFKSQLSTQILIGGVLGTLLVLINSEFRDWQECVVAGAVMSGVFIWLSYSRQFVKTDVIGDNAKKFLWPGSGVLLPIFLFYVLYTIRPAMGADLAGLIQLVLSVIYSGLAYLLWQKRKEPIEPVSIYVFGAGLAYLLAVVVGLSGMRETVGLMAGIILAAFASRKLPVAATRTVAGGLAVLTSLNVVFVRLVEFGAVSNRLVFNELWIYLALPALICGISSWELSKRQRDLWSEGLKAMTLVFAALFFVYQIRHIMNDGNLLANRFTLDEMAMQVLVGLSFTFGGLFIGKQVLDAKTPVYEKILPVLTLSISVVTLIVFGLWICFAEAPILNPGNEINGGRVFNTLMIAYLIPAILLFAIAWVSRGRRPKIYVQIVSALSLVSIIHYLTGMIRHGFSGKMISIFERRPDNLELYAISAAWLLLGIVMLVVGMKAKQQEVRFASAIVIVMTVLKAFLIDMASLEGVLRAFSFVVLGLVLIVIGRVYQRLLFSNKPEKS